MQIQKQNPRCPKCNATFTVRKGKRRNRLQTIPLFQCNECQHRFTASPGRNKSYPLRHIFEALSLYNLGHSISETQRILRAKSHIDIPEGTIRSWLAEHRSFTTYARLRAAGQRLFQPSNVLRSFALLHQQVYQFQVHRPKLQLLLQSPPHQHLAAVRGYLEGVNARFPHDLFLRTDHRSSTFPATINPPISRKENHATRLAALALPTSPTNTKRHETLQRFMLINDSVTIAVEIPVYLTRADIAYFREGGFVLHFDSDVITGHIDFLQIRNGYIHILDYKPEARKEKHAHVQLTIYALALSRRANLPLKNFKCAWFDEYDYFEFFPLQGVYTRRAETQKCVYQKSS